MHLELKETMTRMGTDLKQKVMDRYDFVKNVTVIKNIFLFKLFKDSITILVYHFLTYLQPEDCVQYGRLSYWPVLRGNSQHRRGGHGQGPVLQSYTGRGLILQNSSTF
jgi:hypothetical protein